MTRINGIKISIKDIVKVRRMRNFLTLAFLVSVVFGITLLIFNYGSSSPNHVKIFNDGGRSNSKDCAPLMHIFFIKTHKCGSSTEQNIIWRQALHHNLNLVLPEEGTYFGHPEHCQISQTGSGIMDDEEHFDIFTHHTHFHAANVRSVMPLDTKKVTILREPAAQLESIFNYYHMQQLFKNETDLATLLKIYEVETLIKMFDKRRLAGGRFGRNQMAFDLGMDKKHFGNEEKIQELINMAEVEFDLVLIAEYMEVSIVLLADLMCWPLEEVTFLKLNYRPATQYHTTLTPKDKMKLGEINNVDTIIYNYFRLKFKERGMAYGEDRMQVDVRRLLKLNKALMDECVQEVLPPMMNATRYNKPICQYKMYENAPAFCGEFTLRGKNVTKMFREKQKHKFKTKIKMHSLLQT